MNIGSRIRDLRIYKNITQEELAQKICKSKSAIQKYEGGSVSVTVDVLEDIANALDVHITEFFKDPVDKEITTDAKSDDLLILVKEYFGLKDNAKGQLEYDFNIFMEILKTKYR